MAIAGLDVLAAAALRERAGADAAQLDESSESSDEEDEDDDDSDSEDDEDSNYWGEPQRRGTNASEKLRMLQRDRSRRNRKLEDQRFVAKVGAASKKVAELEERSRSSPGDAVLAAELRAALALLSEEKERLALHLEERRGPRARRSTIRERTPIEVVQLLERARTIYEALFADNHRAQHAKHIADTGGIRDRAHRFKPSPNFKACEAVIIEQLRKEAKGNDLNVFWGDNLHKNHINKWMLDPGAGKFGQKDCAWFSLPELVVLGDHLKRQAVSVSGATRRFVTEMLVEFMQQTNPVKYDRLIAHYKSRDKVSFSSAFWNRFELVTGLHYTYGNVLGVARVVGASKPVVLE